MELDEQTVRRIQIKKAQHLIDKEIGDVKRLEQIQLKVARGLPMLSKNKAYLDALIKENVTLEESEKIITQAKSVNLAKTELGDASTFHCICCGNSIRTIDGDGMCNNCYLDYNIKISKFLTYPRR